MPVRAVYKDGEGKTYSCPVEIHGGKWQMKTSEGYQDITSNFQDDAAGRLNFDCYREETEPADSRLHINRLPGESSFGALQRAYAEKEIVEQRRQRQAARSEIQNVPVDPAKVAAAREINTQIAQAMRPHGNGQGLLIGKKE
jgi:hypothetical protein